LSEFTRSHGDLQPSDSPEHPLVNRQQPALQQLRERYVMSVVCLRPPKLVGDFSRSPHQVIGHADLHRGLEEPRQHRLCTGPGDLFPPGHLVQHRARLRDHEQRRDELMPAQAGKAHRRMARGNRDGRVDNQQLRQWPLRERWSAATQLSAGVPSSPTRHSSGSSDIGCSSSSITRKSWTSIACRAPTRRAGRRPERIQRRTVSGFLPSRSAASATVNTQEMVRQAPDRRSPPLCSTVQCGSLPTYAASLQAKPPQPAPPQSCFTRERSQVRNARGPCEAARPAGRDRQPGPDPLTGHIRAAHGRRVGGRHPDRGSARASLHIAIQRSYHPNT